MSLPPLGRQRPLPPPGRGWVAPGTARPTPWIHTRRAWRLSRYLGRREIDLVLRLRSGCDLPAGYRCRLAAMGLPGEAVTRTLRGIRSLADWSIAWTATAQRFLAETRRPESQLPEPDDRDLALARARMRAASCYHVAHWLAYDDPKAIRAMRSAAVSLFGRAAPLLLPDLASVDVPWRGKALPGYLRRPANATGPLPLVALLNGVTTSKEELSRWADAFLARGQAVLALDQPGTGEATELGRPSADHDDLSDAVLDFAATRADLDERRVALVGISLGGTQAVQAAALDRRLAAAVAVTPPFEVGVWLPYVNPVLLAQVAGFAGGDAPLTELAEEFSLVGVVDRLRVPLLVVGAGRDLVVPPAEAIRLAAAAGPFGTLLWYGEAGHGLYDALHWWTADVAAWLEALFAPPLAPARPATSTRVDPAASRVASPAAPGGAHDRAPSITAARPPAVPEPAAPSSPPANGGGSSVA